MTIDTGITTLGADGLRQFLVLQSEAAKVVTDRFYATHGTLYRQFGLRGREACREDLAFHLEFLRPVLEFGFVQPMVDYLCWLADVLAARAVPVEHLALSLDWLGEYFTEHMASADGAIVAAALLTARDRFLQADRPVAPPKLPVSWPESVAFEAALLAGDQPGATAILESCFECGRSLVEVELHIIQPALYQIGEKWQANQVSVAQEHLATAMAQSVMTMGLLNSPPSPTINKKALLACVEGNHHAVGLRMVADAFQLVGWNVQYLGANVPTQALIQQVATWKPDLLGLSVSFPQHLRMAKAVVMQLVERFGNERPRVMVGGLAINRFNQLATVVGADAFSADSLTAATSAKQIVGG